MKDLFKPFRPGVLLGVGALAAAGAFAQSGVVQEPQQQSVSPTPIAQQQDAAQDPISQLNLTPDQRQQIREIREQTKEERAAVNRRLRETKLALNEAMDADPPNDALIEQRAREAGDAEAAAIRLRALTQTRIRRVLTVEQLRTLRTLQAEALRNRREQRIEDRRNNPNANPRNGMLPNARRTNQLRRKP